MARKPTTKKALLEQVLTRLANLRKDYKDPDTVLYDSQMRDCMWKILGEITALEEVRSVLRNERNTFICP